MYINFFEARFDPRLEAAICLTWFVFDEVGVSKWLFKMLLDHFIQWEDFTDGWDFGLQKLQCSGLKFLQIIQN